MSKAAALGAFLLISLASSAALPGGLDPDSFVEAAKRGTVTYLGNQLPSCSDNDPSYAAAQTQYKDGDGQYVSWDCQKDSSGSQQCWYGNPQVSDPKLLL